MTEVQSGCTSGAISPQQHETFQERRAFVSAFRFLETPRHSLMTVDLVAFYGSIISVSINDKELLIEVGPAQGPDIHQESIVRKRHVCIQHKPAQ